MKKKNLIYGIHDPRKNSVCYVGKSTIGKLRWRIHRNDLRRGVHHNKRLQHIYNKLERLGLGKLRFSVLEYCDCPDDLSDREVWWIADLRSKGIDLVNFTDGGGLRGYTHSAETRRKISEANKGKPHVLSPEGLKSFLRKQRARIATGKQLAALVKGRTDPEVVRRNRESVAAAGRRKKGIPLSLAHREKIKRVKRERLSASSRGETQHLAKLTDEIVVEIRRRYVKYSRKTGYGKLAREYGVSIATIHSAVTGKTWKHVPMLEGKV